MANITLLKEGGLSAQIHGNDGQTPLISSQVNEAVVLTDDGGWPEYDVWEHFVFSRYAPLLP
jgi:hypothetical protein